MGVCGCFVLVFDVLGWLVVWFVCGVLDWLFFVVFVLDWLMPSFRVLCLVVGGCFVVLLFVGCLVFYWICFIWVFLLLFGVLCLWFVLLLVVLMCLGFGICCFGLVFGLLCWGGWGGGLVCCVGFVCVLSTT